MAALCDLCLHALSDSTPLIQQIHITAGHIICVLVEERLFPRADSGQGASNLLIFMVSQPWIT